MKVLSVNIGMPQEYPYGRRMVRTGIYKKPVEHRVRLLRTHVEGDGQADLAVHGGVHMAAYAYPFEHYAFWQRELGRPSLPFGQFGENLTIEGLTEAEARIGAVYRIGHALVQVSEPRIPCFKLVMRMAAGNDFAARFHKSRRLGFYLRILEEGDVGAGDAVALVEDAADSPTLADFIAVSLFNNRNIAELRRVSRARDLPPKWRATLEDHIAAASQGTLDIAPPRAAGDAPA